MGDKRTLAEKVAAELNANLAERRVEAAKSLDVKRRTGTKNVYICDTCRYALVTVDVDKGVTPFMTACPKCDGQSYSCLYRAPTMLEPEAEWYRPGAAELEGRHPSTIEHCRKGGLLRRPTPPTEERDAGGEG